MRLFITSVSIALAIFISGCNSMPDHASYIPKDATLVVSVNTSSLGKKIAWNAIWGSKLLDEMKKDLDKDNMMKDVEKSGIKVMTTYYAYLKNDKRYEGGKKIAAIIPLEDAKKWEVYLKTIDNKATVKDNKDRKEAMLSNDIYAAWTPQLLILTNTIHMQVQENLLDNIDENDTLAYQEAIRKMVEESGKIDEAATVLEMDKAFTVSKSDAITNDKHFTELSKAGHDISFWINYESLSSEYMNAGIAGGLALSSTLFKDAAMAAGFDFEKGTIKGLMRYYISDELKAACNEIGKLNTDKELIDRLPADKLNMIAGWNISPKGTRKMLDNMGVTGFANTALAETGLTLDNIFNAISGDMGIALNNFSSKLVTVPADSFYPGQQEFQNRNSDIDYTFALKIGSKADMDKLIAFAVNQKILIPTGSNSYTVPIGNVDSLHIIISDAYLALSNSRNEATNYQNGANKTKQKNGADIITSHPVGMYFDIHSMFDNMNGDTSMVNITRDLLSNLSFYGGENKGNTFEYMLSIDFSNKDENSLLQLLNYAGKMRQASQKGDAVASR